jgi:HEAT repeat protein
VAVLGLLPARCLLHLLAAPEPALRGHGARLLAASDPARAVARLVPLLDGQEPDPAVRAEVAEALATLADPAVVPALCRALVGEQDVEAQAALRHALLAARGAERAVMELLASSGPDERRAGAAGLGVLSTGLAASTHVGTLLGVVRDPDRGVALEATRALAVAGRSREGRAELVRRAETIATLAREARDDELRRSLRALHHAITGRLP